jgi:hypothetical protein
MKTTNSVTSITVHVQFPSICFSVLHLFFYRVCSGSGGPIYTGAGHPLCTFDDLSWRNCQWDVLSSWWSTLGMHVKSPCWQVIGMIRSPIPLQPIGTSLIPQSPWGGNLSQWHALTFYLWRCDANSYSRAGSCVQQSTVIGFLRRPENPWLQLDTPKSNQTQLFLTDTVGQLWMPGDKCHCCHYLCKWRQPSTHGMEEEFCLRGWFQWAEPSWMDSNFSEKVESKEDVMQVV